MWRIFFIINMAFIGFFPFTAHAAPPREAFCNIKGTIENDKKIYHLPPSPFYKPTKIEMKKNVVWFCSIDEARAAGFTPPRKK